MKKTTHLLWGLGIILLIWLLGHYGIDRRFIPNPFIIIWKSLLLLGHRSFWLHIFASGLRLMAAISSALVFGGLSGIIIASNKTLDRVFSPVLYILFPVPKAAFLPVIFVVFGLTDISKVVLIFLILYFQIAMTVYDGVKAIDQTLYISARSINLKGWQLYRHLIIPAVLPNIFTALRISVGIGVAVLFFVENYATRYGLGYYIMNHWSMLEYEQMYCGILVLSIMGYTTFRLIDYIEKKWVRWV